jgi:hypothetical protein
LRISARGTVSRVPFAYARALAVTISPPWYKPNFLFSLNLIRKCTLHFGSWNSSTANTDAEVTVYELISTVPPPASMTKTLCPRLKRVIWTCPWRRGRNHDTSSNFPTPVPAAQKWKVASPSVTKETRERASSFVKIEARTTDLRRNSCSRPSQPFG